MEKGGERIYRRNKNAILVFAHFTTFPSERKQENAPAGRLRRLSGAPVFFPHSRPHLAHGVSWVMPRLRRSPIAPHKTRERIRTHPLAPLPMHPHCPTVPASAPLRPTPPFSRRSRSVKASERRHNPENPGREPGDSAPKTRPEPRRGGATRRRPPARQPVPAP